MPISLLDLPVELLYEIQLFALSSSLPYASHCILDVFTNSSPHFKAQYLIGRSQMDSVTSGVYSTALRHHICDQEVLGAIYQLLKGAGFPKNGYIYLPKRLFRSLSVSGDTKWTETSPPLPLLRYLYSLFGLPTIHTNSHDGYALTKAVHARFMPLVTFLLQHEASPVCRQSLAVKVAIRQRNLDMVKLLIERPEVQHKGRKRRKMADRLTPDHDMLRLAASVDARDIVEYFYREKRVLPDIRTLHKMTF